MDFRVALRRVEAHEQAERHRLQMEMMIDRVMKIPTLFERYSQVTCFIFTLRSSWVCLIEVISLIVGTIFWAYL